MCTSSALCPTYIGYKRGKRTFFFPNILYIGINIFAIDADNFMECHRMVMLNSFVEKGTKQYPAEIKKAERLLKEWEASL